MPRNQNSVLSHHQEVVSDAKWKSATKLVSLEMQHLYRIITQMQIKEEATICTGLTITMIS